MKKLLFVLPLLILCKGNAQNIEIGGIFPTIEHNGRLTDKWEYSIYYFGAFSMINPKIGGKRESPYLNAFYSEQSVHYRVKGEWSFTVSHVYERQNAFRINYRNENRFYLQTTYKYILNKTGIKHRLRYDGRYIQNRITGQWPYTNRLRYLIAVNTPFKNEKFYFSAYNEFFFNLDKSAIAIYGENWASAGIGIKTNKIGKFELGPLYIFWVAGKNNELVNFYYLQLTWLTHISFKKQL